MQHILLTYTNLILLSTIAFAWIIGEVVNKWVKFIPKISIYILIGLIAGNFELVHRIHPHDITILVNIAIGLILFECGYRVNIRWLRSNPWIGLSALVEAVAVLCSVYAISHYIIGLAYIPSVLISTIVMASAPEICVKVVNALRSAGQVSDRSVYKTTINCMLAIFIFMTLPFLGIIQKTGLVWIYIKPGIYDLGLAVLLGVVFAIVISKVLSGLESVTKNLTITYTFAVILIILISHVTHISFILATLAFGLMSRDLRVATAATQRNFGALGELLTILPFIFFGAGLVWADVTTGLLFASVLVFTRITIQVLCATLFSRVSGISWYKGAMTGLAMSPVSIYMYFILQQTNYLGLPLPTFVIPLAMAVWFLNIFTSILTKSALIMVKEAAIKRGAL